MRRKTMTSKLSDKNQLSDKAKLRICIGIIIILLICLVITTFALVKQIVFVDNNYFSTDQVKISINDGKAVIDEGEFKFEPGMIVKKEFYVKNEGNQEAYYKIYMEAISGGLAEILQVRIEDEFGDEIFNGKASDLTRANAALSKYTINGGHERKHTIYFSYPEEAGNAGQGQTLSFVLTAEATQTKNNPNKAFE